MLRKRLAPDTQRYAEGCVERREAGGVTADPNDQGRHEQRRHEQRRHGDWAERKAGTSTGEEQQEQLQAHTLSLKQLQRPLKLCVL